MKVLVAYASRHGATRGIAERIVQTLGEHGLQAELRPAEDVRDAGAYDAVVVGAAAYAGHWMKEAANFVRQQRSTLATRPVWLFSSGPVGTDMVDKKGRDVLETSVPREFAEFAGTIHPRDERIFFGAYDPDAQPLGLAETLFKKMMTKTIREALPAGDFRDWPAIEAWADGIAQELQPAAPLIAG